MEQEVTLYSKTIDLGMYDYEYLQLIAESRDPVQEQIREQNLIRAGVHPQTAHEVAPLLKKSSRSPEEEALVTRVWRQVRG